MSDWDIVVIGEILGELSSPVAFAHGGEARFAASGDALNVAAAAAAAGAHVAVAAVLPDDALGDAVATRLRDLGVSDALVVRRPGSLGLYLVHSDPLGERSFFYARSGSAGASLAPEDLDLGALAAAGAVVTSGITAAVSTSAREAVVTAARAASRFVYDPNLRPRLTSPADAAAVLRLVAPFADLVTPSCPGETTLLLGTADPEAAAAALLAAGARNAAVTCGARGVLLAGTVGAWLDAVPAPRVVDQSGAGDAFLGTTVARLVLGDGLEAAARAGTAAASLAVAEYGAASAIPAWTDVQRHLAAGGARP